MINKENDMTKIDDKCAFCNYKIDIEDEAHYEYEILGKKRLICLPDGDYILLFMKELSQMKKIIRDEIN